MEDSNSKGQEPLNSSSKPNLYWEGLQGLASDLRCPEQWLLCHFYTGIAFQAILAREFKDGDSLSGRGVERVCEEAHELGAAMQERSNRVDPDSCELLESLIYAFSWIATRGKDVA